MRVCLGRERRVDVARDLSYAHGGAVRLVISRLEARAKSEPVLAEKLALLSQSVQCAATTP